MALAHHCSHGGAYSVDHRLVRVDCSSSVNPLGMPREAMRAIAKDMRQLATTYPDPQCRQLKKAVARYLKVKQEQVAAGNGAAEIIYWFARLAASSVERGGGNRRAIIPAPTFCEYELASQKAGLRAEFVPLTADFALDADAVLAAAARGSEGGAIFLCNPNNPTGRLDTAAVKKIIENAGSQWMVLLDECFIELATTTTTTTTAAGRNGGESMVKLVDDHPNLVVLRSLTKSFGMAGLRAGYSVSSPEIAARLSAMAAPWNVNGLAQAAGVAALASAESHLKKTRALVEKERAFLFERIGGRVGSLTPLKSDANFFMIRLEGGGGKNQDSTEFRDRLLKKTGVLVRDCSTFTGMGSQHIRVAVKTHRENVALVKALEAITKGG